MMEVAVRWVEGVPTATGLRAAKRSSSSLPSPEVLLLSLVWTLLEVGSSRLRSMVECGSHRDKARGECVTAHRSEREDDSTLDLLARSVQEKRFDMSGRVLQAATAGFGTDWLRLRKLTGRHLPPRAARATKKAAT